MENSVMLNAVCNEPVSLKVVQEPFYRKGFSPFVNKETGTWWEYDDDKKGFFDTGIIAQGRDGNDYVITEQDYNTIVERTLSNVNPTLDEKLSSKLPKSPTNWEPWTADEQAAARERMGIPGDYELIADVTTDEETEILFIDKDNDGTDLMLVKAIMFIELPKYEGSLSQLYITTRIYSTNESGVSTRYSSANVLFSKSFNTYGRTDIDLTGGILSANQYLIRSNKNGSASLGSNFGYDYDNSGKLLYIHKVGYERYNANSPIIPAGTRVKLYGVRV